MTWGWSFVCLLSCCSQDPQECDVIRNEWREESCLGLWLQLRTSSVSTSVQFWVVLYESQWRMIIISRRDILFLHGRPIFAMIFSALSLILSWVYLFLQCIQRIFVSSSPYRHHDSCKVSRERIFWTEQEGISFVQSKDWQESLEAYEESWVHSFSTCFFFFSFFSVVSRDGPEERKVL